MKNAAELQLSAQISQILEHYKQPDPLGVPGAQIPDPMKVPTNKQNIPGGTLELRNAQAHGLSKFRIKSVYLDVDSMQVRRIHLIIFSIYTDYDFDTIFQGKIYYRIGQFIPGGKLHFVGILLSIQRTIQCGRKESGCVWKRITSCESRRANPN